MKLKKKYARLLAVLVLVVSISVSSLLVHAANTTKISVTSDANEVERGDVFVLKLSMDSVQDFTGLGFAMDFDHDAFEYKSSSINMVSCGYDASGSVNYHVGRKQVVFGNASINAGSCHGNFAEVSFEVKEKAAAGSYNFNLVLDEFYNGDDDYVLDFEDTSIQINIPATDIEVSHMSGLDLKKGNTSTISVTPIPSDSNTLANLSFTSSNDSVASVDTSGVVTAKASGNAVITVNGYGYQKNFNVVVTNPVTSVELSKTSLTIPIGENDSLVAKVAPIGADDADIIWESDNPNIATVSNGVVTAVGKGTTIIRAKTLNGTKAECSVVVTKPITSVTMDETPFTMNRNDSYQIDFEYVPNDTTDSKVISWSSSNPTVATVNNGLVKAISVGKTTITASMLNGKFKKSVEVTVQAPLTDLNLGIESLELLPTQSKTIIPSYVPSDTTDSKDITWTSSNEDIVTVSNGKIVAVAPGNAIVTANVATSLSSGVLGARVLNGTIEKTIRVKVLVPIENVIIKPSGSFTLNKGETENLSVEIYPADAEEDRTVSWVSDKPSVVSVNKSGNIKALAGGKAIITGKLSNGKSVTASVTVHVPVTDVVLNESKITVHKGESYRGLVATVKPDDATNKSVTWQTSDSSVATVNNGVITGVSDGTAIITATAEGISKSVVVEVDTPVTSVVIDQGSAISLEKGQVRSLTATVKPDDATDKTVSWSSSNDNIVSVDESGNISAKGAGTATITAMSGEKKDTIEVSVVVPITSFELSANEQKLTVLRGAKNAYTLLPLINPSDTTEDKTISWKSSDSTIATIDENGKIIGLKEGTVTITGILKNGMKVESEVTIEVIPLTDIEVEIDSKIYKGRPSNIVIKPIPENTTEFENIKYSSSDDEVFVVNSDGTILGKKEGTATLLIEVGGVTKSFDITIIEIPLESISVSVLENKLSVGDTTSLAIEFNPSDTTDDIELVFTSSNEEVATVDEYGVITAKGAGDAKINVTANNEFSSEVAITVLKDDEDVLVSPKTSVDSTGKYLFISGVSVVTLGGLFIARKKLLK